MSKAAVASLVLALVGIVCFLFPSLLVLCAVGGGLCAAAALRNIRRYPLELAGRSLALVSLVLSLLLLAGGLTFHATLRTMEVPDGYEVVSFLDLKAPSDQPDVPPAYALSLDGKRIYLRGYVFPGGDQTNLKHFVLVSDLGTCCFGGQPKLTHMIEVTLQDPLAGRLSWHKRGMGGVLKVTKEKKPLSGLDGVYYQLDADYVK